MRKFLALILLAVPFVSAAQTGPQMQVSNLQTGEASYAVGQEITGSFVLNNIGDVSIPDVQYRVAVGNYGKEGGILENETTLVQGDESVYLPLAARLEIPFSITPQNLPAGDIGLHVYVTQKNGMLLGWKKIPLQINGVRENASPIIEGYYVIDGEKYSLESGVPFDKDETQSFFIDGSTGVTDGTHDVKVVIYENNFGGNLVSEQVLSVDFIDGIVQILLPEGLKPKQYAGHVSLVEGSNVLTLRYMVAGPQAKVLEVDSDTHSPKKGQDFVVTLTYADTPLNALDPESTEYPENLSARIKILNEKGKIVSEYEQALQVTQKQDLLEVDENSTEEEQEEATKRLEIMLDNTRVLDIPLSAKSKARTLSFEVELFDSKTGEVYDTYKTTLPPSPEGYPARIVLLATLAVILVILALLFKTAKHRIPMVCLALILGSAALVGVVVNEVEARRAAYDYANYNSHRFTWSAPISSLVDGYAVGAPIPLDVKVDSKAWISNGLLLHKIRYPKYTSGWASFTSASAAMSHIQNKKNHGDPNKYVEISSGSTWSKEFSVSYFYQANGSNSFSPNLTPGKHWIPISSRYCTSSHGCAGNNFEVWEICVDGAGVCAGETVTSTTDLCPYVNGAVDSFVQTVIPPGYIKDGNNCTNTCTAPNYGQVCGCNNDGTIRCDGSCTTTNTSCPADFEVSCTASPSQIAGPTNVTFTAVKSGGQGTVTYSWAKIPSATVLGTGLTYTENLSGATTMSITATDSVGNETDNICSVTYNTTTCSGAQPNACASCVSGSWVGSCPLSGLAVNVTNFGFRPYIVAPGGTCKVNLVADNAFSCQLVKGGAVYDTYNENPVGSGDINILSTDTVPETVTVGTYQLQCKGSVGAAYENIGNPKQCIAAPVLREF
jgi:hypothetical protein